eukprot:TRINITY_DN42616_c0_g1_i1.p1 TRINITY_DN42616_c0_g1~~TRINITY_DN42616_c0_g1_i1.p1  ORF type:complete len:504 (+),score=118.96 TRINITY_DN42616_c0_g1_i1:58-1569(+)
MALDEAPPPQRRHTVPAAAACVVAAALAAAAGAHSELRVRGRRLAAAQRLAAAAEAEAAREREMRLAAQAALQRVLARGSDSGGTPGAGAAPTAAPSRRRSRAGAGEAQVAGLLGPAAGVLSARPRGGLNNQREAVINMAVAARELNLALLLPHSYPTFHDSQDAWLRNTTRRHPLYRAAAPCGGLRRGHFGCLWDDEHFIRRLAAAGLRVLHPRELPQLGLPEVRLPAFDGVGGFWGCPEAERKDANPTCFRKTLAVWKQAVTREPRRPRLFVAGMLGWNVNVARHVERMEQIWGALPRAAAQALRPAAVIAAAATRVISAVASRSAPGQNLWWGLHLHDQMTCRELEDPVSLVLREAGPVISDARRKGARAVAGAIYVVSKHPPPERLRALAAEHSLVTLSKFDMVPSVFERNPEELYPPEVCAALNFAIAEAVPQVHVGMEVSSFHQFVRYYRGLAGRPTRTLDADFAQCGHLPATRWEKWPNWGHLPRPRVAPPSSPAP